MTRILLATLVAAATTQAATAPSMRSAAEQEAKFAAIVEMTRTAWTRADTQFAREDANRTRASVLCMLVPGGSVVGWTGYVVDVPVGRDGSLGLKVRVSSTLTLGTQDLMGGTGRMSPPGSPLARVLATLRKGDRVAFGGEFTPDKADCFAGSVPGMAMSTDLLFRFEAVAKP